MRALYRTFIAPLGMLTGTIIGAGLFALPFVFAQAGLLAAVLYLGLFGVLVSVLHIMYADIILRTDSVSGSFPSYAGRHLGRGAERFSNAVILVTLLFTLVAFLALSAAFSALLLPNASLPLRLGLFSMIVLLLVLADIRRLSWFDSASTALTIGPILAIFAYQTVSRPLSLSSLPIFHPASFLSPIGPVLFSFFGLSAIPMLVAYASQESIPADKLRRTIAYGTLLPGALYILFILAIWGLSGSVTPDSITGLIGRVPRVILLLIGILGFASLADSYGAAAIDARTIIQDEWHLSRTGAIVAVSIAPILLYAIGLSNFLALIGFIGGILHAVWGILIILVWWALPIPRVPDAGAEQSNIPGWVAVLLFAILSIALVYETIQLATLLSGGRF